MLNGNPLVSVIVPIYNVEDYLKECLDSIINQNYKHLEIILVNDGSTDLSGSIAQEYANKDSRIRYFHQENKGQSAARNAGLDVAKGEFVCFIDSDDYIDISYIGDFMSALKYGDIVLNTNVVFEYPAFNAQWFFTLCKQGVFTLSPHAIRFFEYFAWNVLFKRDIIESYKLRFPHRSNAEDSDFLYRYLCFTPQVCFIYAGAYHYRQREDSTLGLMRQTQAFPLEPIDTFISIYQWYKKYNFIERYGLPFKLLYTFSLEHSNAQEFFDKAYSTMQNLHLPWHIICHDRIMKAFMQSSSVLEFIYKRDAIQCTLKRKFRIRLFRKYSVVRLFGFTLYEKFTCNQKPSSKTSKEQE